MYESLKEFHKFSKNNSSHRKSVCGQQCNNYIYSFIYGLFDDTTVVHLIMTSYERLTNERRILKAVKESGRGLM
jgi:hypothetical protein